MKSALRMDESGGRVTWLSCWVRRVRALFSNRGDGIMGYEWLITTSRWHARRWGLVNNGRFQTEIHCGGMAVAINRRRWFFAAFSRRSSTVLIKAPAAQASIQAASLINKFIRPPRPQNSAFTSFPSSLLPPPLTLHCPCPRIERSGH